MMKGTNNSTRVLRSIKKILIKMGWALLIVVILWLCVFRVHNLILSQAPEACYETAGLWTGHFDDQNIPIKGELRKCLNSTINYFQLEKTELLILFAGTILLFAIAWLVYPGKSNQRMIMRGKKLVVTILVIYSIGLSISLLYSTAIFNAPRICYHELNFDKESIFDPLGVTNNCLSLSFQSETISNIAYWFYALIPLLILLIWLLVLKALKRRYSSRLMAFMTVFVFVANSLISMWIVASPPHLSDESFEFDLQELVPTTNSHSNLCQKEGRINNIIHPLKVVQETSNENENQEDLYFCSTYDCGENERVYFASTYKLDNLYKGYGWESDESGCQIFMINMEEYPYLHDYGYRYSQDSFWSIDKYKNKKKIFTTDMIRSFFVSDDGELIVLTTLDYEMVIINKDGDILVDSTLSRTVHDFWGDTQSLTFPLMWHDRTLWIKDAGAGNVTGGLIVGLTRVEVDSGESEYYDLESLGWMEEYDLNPSRRLLVFSDYPVIYDKEIQNEFYSSGDQVKLMIYNLETEEKQIIDTSITKRFEPKWIDENTFEYDDPDGSGRKTVSID